MNKNKSHCQEVTKKNDCKTREVCYLLIYLIPTGKWQCNGCDRQADVFETMNNTKNRMPCLCGQKIHGIMSFVVRVSMVMVGMVSESMVRMH